LLRLLGDSPRQAAGGEPPIPDDQSVSRFIYSSDLIYKDGGKAKTGAFMPRFERDFNRHETSVCHLNGSDDARVWQLAVDSRPGQELRGRVDFAVGLATAQELSCLSSPEHNYAEHAVLVNWPLEKEDQKRIALALAKACPPVTTYPSRSNPGA
jgi:hypothetical protein